MPLCMTLPSQKEHAFLLKSVRGYVKLHGPECIQKLVSPRNCRTSCKQVGCGQSTTHCTFLGSCLTPSLLMMGPKLGNSVWPHRHLEALITTFVITQLRQIYCQCSLYSAVVLLKTSMVSMKTSASSDNMCSGFKLLSARDSGGFNHLFMTAWNMPGA